MGAAARLDTGSAGLTSGDGETLVARTQLGIFAFSWEPERRSSSLRIITHITYFCSEVL